MDTRPPFNLHCNDMQGYAPNAVGHGGSESRKQDGRTIYYRREVTGGISTENLNTRIWEFVNGSCLSLGRGCLLSLVVVGSERAGVSSRH